MNIIEEELDKMYRHYLYNCDLEEKIEKRDGERRLMKIEEEPPFNLRA
jgi:hypothetical protein